MQRPVNALARNMAFHNKCRTKVSVAKQAPQRERLLTRRRVRLAHRTVTVNFAVAATPLTLALMPYVPEDGGVV